jgi:hypothetical protein
MSERTETQNPSGLTNAEIDQLMAPLIARITRRARRYVWMFAGLSLAMAVVLIPVLRVGASASLDLTIVSLVFVAAPPALIARAYVLWNIPRARLILQRGTSVPARVVKNEVLAIRHRNRISLEWKPTRKWSTMKADSARIEVERIDTLEPVTVVVHPRYQRWVCFILNDRVFLGRMWEFRRDL